MNVLINLVTLYNHLPYENSYRSVIKCILTHIDEMPNATIYDVADFTASSRATVWRLVKMLGYTSYAEFSNELNRIIRQPSYYNWACVAGRNSTLEEIVDGAAERIQDMTALVKETCLEEQFTTLIDLLHEKRRVCFYNLPTSGTYFLVQNLFLSGKEVGEYALYMDMLEDASQATPDTLIFSCPLEYPDMMDLLAVFERAKERGATLVIGTDENSRYAKVADYLLFAGKSSAKNKRIYKRVYEELFSVMSDVYRIQYMDQ